VGQLKLVFGTGAICSWFVRNHLRLGQRTMRTRAWCGPFPRPQASWVELLQGGVFAGGRYAYVQRVQETDSNAQKRFNEWASGVPPNYQPPRWESWQRRGSVISASVDTGQNFRVEVQRYYDRRKHAGLRISMAVCFLLWGTDKSRRAVESKLKGSLYTATSTIRNYQERVAKGAFLLEQKGV